MLMAKLKNIPSVGHTAHLGISPVDVDPVLGSITVSMTVAAGHLAPHSFAHGGALTALADTAAGWGAWISLADYSEGLKPFLTSELKVNFVGSAKEGDELLCQARIMHAGKRTQVWDADVTHADSGKRVALFRCTQMVLA